MKINIAIIGPPEGIGGGNRKYRIYFNYLDKKKFNKFYISLSDVPNTNKNISDFDCAVSENELENFIDQHNIKYVYLGNRLSEESLRSIKNKAIILKNINFTKLYEADNRILNLIISKTDYLKIKLINGNLKNAYVVYNPIDFNLWNKLSQKKNDDYRAFFENKNIKFIVGRLARAEPSKWEFLIIKTLLHLHKEKKYDQGFVFAGMPWLYRFTIKHLTNKKMQNNILFLPELKSHQDLAKFYRSIDLFWQTSHIGESFGNVIAESFCFKVPVITDHKKFLDDKGNVNKERYDAQIELVDNELNGAYCNNPYSTVAFFDKANKKMLRRLGQHGYIKVKKLYDAKIAGQTLARILYDFLRTTEEIKRYRTFEKISQIPSKKEVDTYYAEYVKRIREAEKIDAITWQKSRCYKFQKTIWTVIEIIYLGIRKGLKIIKIDIENPN